MRSGVKAAKDAGRIRSAGVWLGLLAIASAGVWAYAATDRGPLRSRVFKLRHIDTAAAKELLVRLKLGVEYTALPDNTLLVTSDRPLDLIKTTSVMTVADRETPAEIRPLMALSEGVVRPKTEELAVRLRTLTVGTLLDGPPSGVPNPTIVDVFEGMLIGIGTPEALAMVETAIQAWQEQKAPKEEPATTDAAPTAEARPSLAEVAAALMNRTNGAPVGDPNAVDPAAEQPETTQPAVGTTEPAVETTTPAEPTVPVTEAVTAEQALQDLQRQAEAAGEPDTAAESLRAMMEMLRRSVQEPDQPMQTTPTPEAAPAAQTPAAAETPAVPRAGDMRVVTGPMLPEERAAKELELTITLPEEVEIEKLLELVGKQLGLNYMYDKAIFAGAPGKVSLSIHDGKINLSELYSLLESVLRFRGFVMTRRDRLVTIVRQQDIGNVDPLLRQPDEEIQPGHVVVSSVFHLTSVNPVTAQNLLSQMRLGTGFNVIPETGTLIVTDYAFRMERIREVISMIDVAGTPKDFQFRQLRYMQAGELVPKVRSLAAQIKGVTVTVPAAQAAAPPVAATPAATAAAAAAAQRAAAAARTTPTTPAAAAAAAAAVQETVYLEADDRTNRVLMIGYPAEMETINQLIDSLDVAGFDLRFVREYVIQYVEATDVVTVLNELGLARVSVGSGRQQQAARQTTAARPGQALTPQQLAQQQQQQAQLAAQQQMTTTGGGSINDPYISLRAATNSLLVNATDEQHKAIELVISHVDVMQKDQRTIREYEIQYVDTQSVLDTLGDLGIITPRSTATTTGVGTGAAARTSAQQQQQQQLMGGGADGLASMALPTPDGTEREITAQEPQIAVLAATNSLLVHATPRQHTAIAMVIAHTDREAPRVFAPYVVYALENQDPLKLAEVLNKLIQETVDESTRAAPSAPDARIQTRPTQTVTTLPSGEEQRIRIVPDEKTYSLIVYANKRNQQWVGELIRELDEYRPQVLLDCTLVEITQNERFRYELDIIAKSYGGELLKSGSNLIGSRALFSSSDSIEARSNSGQGSVFFNSNNVQVLLDTVQGKGFGRIMARPKLLVNDSQEGEIRSENTVAVPQVKTIVQIPAAGGTPVTSTDVSFIDYVAGVNLKIRPIISKGDMLRLEITMNRTDFANTSRTVSTTEGDVPVPPDRLSTDVLTTATIPDGTTIILGGLETINQNKQQTKVPILGDLPILGGLFRGINNTGNQSRLYVFVTASILRPADQLEGLQDMRRVSEHNRRSFETYEERFQKMEDWPGIKPKPMDPGKVLDDQYAEDRVQRAQPPAIRPRR